MPPHKYNPKTAGDPKKDAMIGFKCPAATKELIMQRAEAANQTISTTVLQLINLGLRR